MIDKFDPDVRILVYGAGSFACLIAEMARESGLGSVYAFYTPESRFHPRLLDYNARLIDRFDDLLTSFDQCSHYIVAIGNEFGYARVQIALALEQRGLMPMSVIHPKAVVAPTAQIGKGCVVMASASIQHFTKLGNYSIINTNATIDHETVIGSGVHVMGGSSVAGRVSIGDYATVGTNATILPDAAIGRNAYIGAGAVVVKEVGDDDVVIGVPARFLRKQNLATSLYSLG